MVNMSQSDCMFYIYACTADYSDEAYQTHLSALPAWRKEKALQYKKLGDRKRCVLAFVLLQHALREEYGITEVPEFVYNEFGKPSFPNLPIHFSLSHCKDAVVCAVSDQNIGVDVESIVAYNTDVARRVCTASELEALRCSLQKDLDFTTLWTKKEAVAKFEGMGLSMELNKMEMSKYRIDSIRCDKFVLSVCGTDLGRIEMIDSLG